MPLDSKIFNTTIEYLKSAVETVPLLDQWDKLAKFIQQIDTANPYDINDKEYKDIMWREQCYINFPLLYLTSIYLNFYARERGCDTFLFATRDCCHLYRIFNKLFPNLNVHYFNCSRLMFESSFEVENPTYSAYISSIVSDVNKTIFIDLHGTGRRVLSYFDKYYGQVPYCFLLSAGAKVITDLPEITQYYNDQAKFFSLVFNTRGGPIEMLNYDIIGTLVEYSPLIGPVRKPLEYCKQRILPYHDCIDFILNKLEPISLSDTVFDPIQIQRLIKNIAKGIQKDRPIISKYIEHTGRHKVAESTKFTDVIFGEVFDDSGVYGVIWGGTIHGTSVAIKMVALNSSSGKTFHDNPSEYSGGQKPFIHDLFKDHKYMNRNTFLHEANRLVDLASYDLAPTVFGFWICEIYDIHYGFIVMDRMDCSVKSILLKRSLNNTEESRISVLIEKLHKKGIVHGDMKPSNIGVLLNLDGEIIKCRFLDTQKVKHKKDLGSKKFQRLVADDLRTYRKHYEKNRNS